MKFAERPMGSKRIIKAKEIAADLRSGMTAKELMIKYNVTPNTLRNMLRTLVNGRAISEEEANSVIVQLEEGSSPKNRRKYPRYFVYVPLPIYDTDNLLTEGQVVDISEEGLRIRGIEAEPGDKKEFVVQPDYYGHVFPFSFEAECKWASKNAAGEPIAGFKITDISDGGREQIRKIIRLLALDE
ncbi:MAG: PilZ domain-containing protein [Desulfomonilaceae bacterium]